MPVALIPLLLAGCSSEEPPAPGDRSRHEKKAQKKERPRRQVDVTPALARALRERAAAIRSGDQAGFLAGVARGDAGFVADQAAYLANLDQLPLARFGYSLEPTSVARSGRGYWATVEVTMQLDGYDSRPVVTPDRYLFTRQGKGRFAVASVTDRAWESQHRAGSPALGPRADHGAHRQPGSRDLRRGQQGVGRRRGPRGRGGGLDGRLGDPVRVGRRGGALRPRRPDLPVGPGQRARIRPAQPRRGVVRGHGQTGRTEGGQHPLRAQPRRARRGRRPAGAGSSGTS